VDGEDYYLAPTNGCTGIFPVVMQRRARQQLTSQKVDVKHDAVVGIDRAHHRVDEQRRLQALDRPDVTFGQQSSDEDRAASFRVLRAVSSSTGNELGPAWPQQQSAANRGIRRRGF